MNKEIATKLLLFTISFYFVVAIATKTVYADAPGPIIFSILLIEEFLKSIIPFLILLLVVVTIIILIVILIRRKNKR